MSHVATVECEIKDLAHLRMACAALGIEFVEGQKTYRWFGHSVGDYPLPAGFAESDLGHCEHAIRLPSGHPNFKTQDNGIPITYEIGVVCRRDGKPGWSLMWDFFCGGFGLQDVVGENCGNIRREYARAAAVATAQKQGFRVQQTRLADGKIRLKLSK